MVSTVFNGVTFRVNGILFAMEALKVREVIGGAVWLFTENGVLRDAIQSRGRNIPVVDLRRLFGFESLEKQGRNSFIAVQMPGADRNGVIALWVDLLMEMVNVPVADLKAVAESIGGIPARFFQAAFEKDGETVFIIQTDEIVREAVANEQQLDKAAS